MLKICGDTICNPLELIFKQALTNDVFPSEWKKSNIVSYYKKGDKQNLKNYLSAENFLKDSYLMKCLVFFWLTTS